MAHLGRYVEAMECYGRAIELNPESHEAWNLKGEALENLGKIAESLTCFDRAIEIRPFHGPAWNGKGKAMHELGKFEEAIMCFDKALELKSDDIDGLLGKGAAIAALGNHPESIQLYAKALDVDVENARTWKLMAESLSAMGKAADAELCMARVREFESRPPKRPQIPKIPLGMPAPVPEQKPEKKSRWSFWK